MYDDSGAIYAALSGQQQKCIHFYKKYNIDSYNYTKNYNENSQYIS